MLIVHVEIQVKEGDRDAFVDATRTNAEASRREAGVFRFKLMEFRDDPLRFLLVEIYRDDQAPAAHKETAHYKTWAAAVAPWMARPRQSVKYRAVAGGGL